MKPKLIRETNELQLRIGPYKTTFVGIEIMRASTLNEWQNYGGMLKRIDEAKQWAIGDWLVDGKRHYGDGLYEKAEGIVNIDKSSLRTLKSIAERYELLLRNNNLTWNHHKEVASLKKTYRPETGKWKVSDEPDTDKIQEFLKRAEEEKLSVRELRDIVSQFKANQQREIELANEPEKYRIVLADPPWSYSNTMPEYFIEQGDHYSLMTIDEICAFPIKKITTENSVLFLWVTSPILEESFQVVKSWGFEYKSSFVWDKIKHNIGHYNSLRHELLLVCTKGSCRPDTNKLYDSVVSIERTEHSEKPKYFRELIDALYPTGRRIEIFARKKADNEEAREHFKLKNIKWEFYGDEC